jgi:hypothetical protein
MSLESAPVETRFVTRNEAPVKSSPLMTKRRSDGVRKVARKPGQKRAVKPAAVTGYHWRKNGTGWDLRKDVYVTSNEGVRKRRQPFVAHLSKSAFGEMKRRHRGAALERAIAAWIEGHDR